MNKQFIVFTLVSAFCKCSDCCITSNRFGISLSHIPRLSLLVPVLLQRMRQRTIW